ncbi:amidohydrolase family protein [Candidatus Deferrimicrobium sp.]|uniref:amidohydrolase family protein n=1 Tax=Candidatus Deferrimicrobium sp. TaxID=3060586 RepID=UPI00271C3BB8|nr:amidohydrolase family protein [Candidatus Deferrimicrobium sp.]MDO8738005.1 amidohydrolase family protein [Candidatus Deferrimicrobium sp.]
MRGSNALAAECVVYVASRLVAAEGATFSPGALAVADGAVLLAGRKEDVLRAAPAGSTRIEFPGEAILPGLVNAHVHLQIPRFIDDAGKPLPIPPSFVDWILRVIAWRLGAAPASLAENFRAAAAEALSFGTTTVGEIAGPDLPSYDGCPLRARVFAEGIGFAPNVAPEVLALVSAAIERLEKIAAENPLVLAGVSPHTLYTVGESLLRSLAELAAAKGLPACLHLAESTPETAFLSDGGGEIASRLYPAVGKDVSWFRGLGRTIPAYLAETGLLREGVLLVHNVHLARPEIDALRGGGARFVLCPRSNAAHGNGAPDVTHFVDAKIPFALGTDSLGSVPDHSLWSEMRAARSLYRGRKKDAVLCRELFRAATEHGAFALGLPGGILVPGGPADVTIVDDPGGDGDRFFRDLVEKTDRANVRVTVVAGQSAHGAAA